MSGEWPTNVYLSGGKRNHVGGYMESSRDENKQRREQRSTPPLRSLFGSPPLSSPGSDATSRQRYGYCSSDNEFRDPSMRSSGATIANSRSNASASHFYSGTYPVPIIHPDLDIDSLGPFSGSIVRSSSYRRSPNLYVDPNANGLPLDYPSTNIDSNFYRNSVRGMRGDNPYGHIVSPSLSRGSPHDSPLEYDRFETSNQNNMYQDYRVAPAMPSPPGALANSRYRKPIWKSSNGPGASQVPAKFDQLETKLDSSSTQANDVSISLEVYPGHRVRLRGARETWTCVANDFYVPTVCFACSMELCCIQDADFVLCPICRVVSPMKGATTSSEKGSGGVALGFTMDDLCRWQSEIISGRDQRRLKKSC